MCASITHQRLVLAAFLVITVSFAAALATSPHGDPDIGFSDRPVATEPLTASVAEDSIQFFRDKKFEGDMTQVSEVTGKEPWNAHSFESKAKHFSSVRWNLPRGVIATLFAENNSTGKSLSIWGSGEIAELSKWKMNDDLSGWAWNGVGGVVSPSKQIAAGFSERPKYAKATEGVSENSLQLFKNAEAKGDMQPLDSITDKPANVLHEMPKGTSSLKWNLPAGVVVVFSETKQGVGPNLAIWGKGQFDSVALWQMNDKLHFYAWHYLGESVR